MDARFHGHDDKDSGVASEFCAQITAMPLTRMAGVAAWGGQLSTRLRPAFLAA